jgi:RNA-directed DNA polymerase
MIRGQADPLYLRFYDQFCSLAKIPNNKAVRISKTKLRTPRIVTEGKTDWKHLKVALDKLQAVGLFKDLKVVFEEYEGDMPAGGGEIKELCIRTARLPQSVPIVFVFDNDDSNIVKIVTEKERPYKSWGNNVFSFVIPVPNHRTETPEVSIELYYKDSEITRVDNYGRRLYLSSEFKSRSGWHKLERLTCMDSNKIRNERKLCVIDSQVYNEAEENVALSKSDFASHIIGQETNFNDFDCTSFSLIFSIIQQIIEEN